MLPIEDVLDELIAQLSVRSTAVLEAAPGAGKTTRVPLALLNAGSGAGGRIIMLEPRRIAARTTATFMAEQLGERVGDTVGYRMRGDTRVGPHTHLEIVTEGVLARIRASDPLLMDVGTVIFDEFHERSLHGDLALALVLETKELLRPELQLLVMSATLDGDAVAQLLSDSDGPAPVVKSKGRQYPIETVYMPPRRGEQIPAVAARAVREALSFTEGGILVFLPGASEQWRTDAALAGTLPAGVDVYVLHGSQDLKEQMLAIAPAPSGRRKIVLATNVAETSVTIEDVRTVIDTGYSRAPRYSIRTGTTTLDTVRVSRASADQRRGRAGRVAPGWCIRLWDMHEDATLTPRSRPEILEADLAPLVLELAGNGIHDVRQLRWLDQPPDGAVAAATELLQELEALSSDGRITAHGTDMLCLPTEPRMAHMLLRARDWARGGETHANIVALHAQADATITPDELIATAAIIAALAGERDIISVPRHESPADLRLRLEAIAGDRESLGTLPLSRDTMNRVRRAANDLLRHAAAGDSTSLELLSGRPESKRPLSGKPLPGITRTDAASLTTARAIAEAGSLVALAWPERIAQRRSNAARYLLRNGSGAQLSQHDALAGERYLAVAALDGTGADARISLAVPINEETVRELFQEQITVTDHVEWDENARAVRGWRREQLGAIVLTQHRITAADPDEVLTLVRNVLLSTDVADWPLSDKARETRARLAFAHAHDAGWPDVSDNALHSSAGSWLNERLRGVDSWQALEQLDWNEVLLSLLDWKKRQELDRIAPTHITVPSGSRIPIDYSDPLAPVLAVRLQEVFGWEESPRVMNDRVQLTMHLLSPAHRPLQVTRDLAGFWKSSYRDVRSEMRGRYPRHVWPEDPVSEPATRRAKPRKK